MKRRLTLALLMILALSIVISCSKSPSAKIQGVYEADKEAMKKLLLADVEAEEDNEFVMGMIEGMIENSKIEICVKGDAISGIMMMFGGPILIESPITVRNDTLVVNPNDTEAYLIPTETGLIYKSPGEESALVLTKTDRNELSAETQEMIKGLKAATQQ